MNIELVSAIIGLLTTILGLIDNAVQRWRDRARAKAAPTEPQRRRRKGFAGVLFLILALTAGATLYFNLTRTQPPILSLTPDRGGAGTTITTSPPPSRSRPASTPGPQPWWPKPNREPRRPRPSPSPEPAQSGSIGITQPGSLPTNTPRVIDDEP